MMSQGLLILLLYFAVLIVSVTVFRRRTRSGTEFLLGSRSLGFWLTALSAHASDMSAWLFLGYPALILQGGVAASWAAIGLIAGMFLNWQFVARRLRSQTEKFGSLTLSAYFESRLSARSHFVRLFSSVISMFFFTCYVASGLVALGILSSALLGIPALIGSSVGLVLIVFYVLSGGYRTIAWVDLVQGCFLLGVIVFIPLYALNSLGGVGEVLQSVEHLNRSVSLFPEGGIGGGLLMALGWGLGYFGQPQILTKFMGISDVAKICKAKYLGIGWQCVAMGSATLIGLIGIATLSHAEFDAQYVTLEVVNLVCPSWLVGVVLCAIVAATTNVMAAQLLVVASNLSEDVYRAWLRPQASSWQLLQASRYAVIGVACASFVIAFMCTSSVYQIVFYAWSGLGASFGPLVLLSLYSSKLNSYGACIGMLVGGLFAALWPLLNTEIPALIPGFFLGAFAIYFVSRWTAGKPALPASDPEAL